MNSDTIRDLCTAFRLGTLHAVEPLGGTRNANYLVTTSSGKWFVRRRYEGYCDPARIAFDHQVLRHLGNRRAPVPVPLQATDGQTWRRDADRAWEVHPFVEGAHLREGRAEDLEALGSGLALFHEAGVDFPGRFDKLSPRGETDPRVIEGQANRIVADDPGCAAALERYREWTASAGDDVPDPLYAALHHTIVHGDVQPANILINEGRVAAFVDLDWCGWRPRIYDLAYALLFCCTTHEMPIRGEDIRSLTQPFHTAPLLSRAFLEAYQRHASPLDEREGNALRAQVVLTWCHCRVAGALKVPREERAAFLSRPPDDLPQEAEALLAH